MFEIKPSEKTTRTSKLKLVERGRKGGGRERERERGEKEKEERKKRKKKDGCLSRAVEGGGEEQGTAVFLHKRFATT